MSYRAAIEIRERQRVAFERETFARWRKVCLIVALVPNGETVGLNGAAATLMESWTQEQRDVFADAAGAKSPSEETWRLVCEVVRTRPVPSMADADAHTRALPLLRVLQGGAGSGKLACESCRAPMDRPFELVGPNQQEFCEGCAKKYHNAMAYQAGAGTRGGRS